MLSWFIVFEPLSPIESVGFILDFKWDKSTTQESRYLLQSINRRPILRSALLFSLRYRQEQDLKAQRGAEIGQGYS